MATKTETPTSSTEAFDAAYRQFLAAVQAPWEEAQKQMMQSQFDYARAVQEASTHPDAPSRTAAARRAFLAATTGAARDDDPKQAVQAAYQDYLGAIRKAWSKVDPALLEAAALAAVGNQILSVCSFAGWSQQQASAIAQQA